MNKIYYNVYYAFTLASAVLLAISLFTSGTTSIDTSLTAFSTLTVSILMVMVFLLNTMVSTKTSSVLQSLFILGPFLCIFFIIACFIYLFVTYKNQISENHVSSSFFTFQKISVILILVQSYLFYTGMNVDTGKISKSTVSFIYLICVINFFILFMIRNMLVYFVTDGFQSSSANPNTMVREKEQEKREDQC